MPDIDKDRLTQEKQAERARLSELKDAPLSAWHRDSGVLLSDRIRFYSQNYDMITPFCEEDLRPAGYDLRVGDRYSVAGGSALPLGPGDEITIPPYQVAIIQIRETLNLPKFIIGRWNIRVKLAYKGLLWVGGAQVDPGWRGQLCCPIYNLSYDEVRLRHGDPLAAIDFVLTSAFIENESKPFEWSSKALVFEEYPKLNSGVAQQLSTLKNELATANRETSQSLAESQKRIDNFVSLVFVVVSVLFTALGLIATKGSTETSILGSPIWISVIALYFALRSFVGPTPQVDAGIGGTNGSRLSGSILGWFPSLSSNSLQIFFGISLALLVLIFHFTRVNLASIELKEAKTEAMKAQQLEGRNKSELDGRIKELYADFTMRLAATEREVQDLKQKGITPAR